MKKILIILTFLFISIFSYSADIDFNIRVMMGLTKIEEKDNPKYKKFLKSGAEIWFKTDDDELFEESLEYFKECNLEIKYITYDLHASGFEGNVSTEHEEMFTAQGIKTKFLIAEYK